MPLEHFVQSVGVFCEMLQGNGAIFDERHGFAVALHRHDDVEGGLPHRPDFSLQRRIFCANESVGVAERGEEIVEAREVVNLPVAVLA